MTLRVCPLCTLRPAAIIDPACYVCAGHGVLELGHAIREYDGPTVSTALALALEGAARDIDKRTDARNVDPKPHLEKTIAKLVRAGLLTPPKAPAPVTPDATGKRSGSCSALAHRATGRMPDMTDQLMIRAHPYPYRHTDRPGARGLPLMSANFHPSSLARIGNPFPFDHDTTTELTARQKRRYDARAIVYYLTGVS